MAAMVARGSQLSSSISNQEKGSRNKRKFRADAPLVSFTDCDSVSNNSICDTKIECPNYEFSTEKTQNNESNLEQHHGYCDLCSFNLEQLDLLKSSIRSGNDGSDLGYEEVLHQSQSREELEVEEFQDADWSDPTEAQLEELVLSNLDAIFKSAIKKISSCGYSDEVATKAVLRSGLCYGRKDTISNIVDNTLAYLRNGQEMDSKDQFFEDLQQLEKYILDEMVCVLREVGPFFSTGDAMWCLLICDMNVSHACAMDGDPLNNFSHSESVENSSVQTSSNSTSESNCSNINLPESNIPKIDKPNSDSLCHHSQSEMPTVAGIPNLPMGRFSSLGNKSKPLTLEGKLQENSNPCCSSCSSTAANLKCGTNSTTSSSRSNLEESASILREKCVPSISQSSRSEEKPLPYTSQAETVKSIHMNSSKRESLLRQKSGQMEKIYRSNAVKGSSRMSKGNGFGGLILDKKCKAVSGLSSPMQKSASAFQLNKAIAVESSHADGHCQKTNCEINAGPLNNSGVNSKKIDGSSSSLALLANTDLSLSLGSKNKVPPEPNNCDASASVEEASNFNYTGIPLDKILENFYPDGTKDEIVLKLVPRVHELQSQMQEWTEWAQQKVMQAARRLSKDKLELKTLKQEKEEVARLKKEKQTLEENTMKKLSEMENALGKASGQVERANAAVRRLESENSELRKEMEAAKLQAAESAASCQEVSRREKKTHKKFQSWERQKSLFQEELATEKHKLSQLQQKLEQAKDFQAQLEARWKQEEKARDEAVIQVNSERKEREQIEIAAKSQEDLIRLKAETDFQKYRDDIKRLENEIVKLRLKTDPSKILPLCWGIDSSYASCLTETRHVQVLKETNARLFSEIAYFQDSQLGDVQRERECVMCLSEEMSVVFLPCAHQVVCTKCNDLHEKQGMKDCPSCRTPIQLRICVRSADS